MSRPRRLPAIWTVAAGVLLVVADSLVGASVAAGQPADPVPAADPPTAVDFATGDGGRIFGDLYEPRSEGHRGVVLAHGRVFDRQSWSTQARQLQSAGLRALAIDFRGYGSSVAGRSGSRALDLDVLAAVRFLHAKGVERVSVVGASMGGGASALAATRAGKGEIDRLLLLAAAPIEAPEAMRADSILFVVSDGDRLLPRVRQQFELAPEPKRLEVIEGDAHAQHLFNTQQATALTEIIVEFVAAPDPREEEKR